MHLGRDFVNVWHGGALAAAGKSALLYDIEGYRESLWHALGVKGIYAYSYPPHSLFLAIPFSLLPYWAALLLWLALGLAMFTHAAAPYLRAAGLPVWLGAVLPAGFVNIWAGHYGFLIGALALYGWRWLDRTPRRSGLAFALMTVKPHLGLLVAPLMLVRRNWSAFAAASLGTLALVLASALLFGWRLWPTYLLHTLGFHAGLLEAPRMAFHTMMPTATMAALQLGLAKPWADAAQIATALYASLVIWRCVAARIATADLGLVAGTAIFLILPYAFVYDMTVHSLAALVFAARASGAEASRQRMILGLAFVLPLIQMPLAMSGLPIAPLILLLALREEGRIAIGRTSQ